MRSLLAVLVLSVVASAPPSLSAQVVRRGELGDAQRAHLLGLGPAAAGFVIDPLRGGRVAQKVLGTLPLREGTLQARCDELVARHGVLFGVTAATEFGAPVVLREQARAAGNVDGAATGGQPLNVRLPQMVQGFPLQGHGLWLRFDAQGQLACVHGVLSEEATQLPPPALSPQVAELIALDHLDGLGHGAASFLSGPRTVTLARLVEGSPRLVHDSHVVLREHKLPLVVATDAQTGVVLGVRENTSTGTGTYHSDGFAIPFKTGGGSGLVYKKPAHALLSKPGVAGLQDVGREDVVPGLAEDGFLFGRFAAVIDEAGFIFSSPSHNWTVATDDDASFGDPFADGQLFDSTNTYYWITRMGHFMEGPFGTPLGTDYAIPVVVNVDGLINAFYSSDDLGFGTGPGFFAFGDADSFTGDSMDDFSRDPTVVCHEYAHGVCDKSGLLFGDNDIDTPPRAVNEAVADYFSAAFNKTPCIGPVFAFWFGPDLDFSGDCLRDLAEERVFPEDLFFATGQSGLPEEHEAGVIFGATLWRYSQALKKAGPATIADSMFDWPQSNAEVGFPDVDVNNAEAAYKAFMGACVVALLDTAASGPGKGSPAEKAGKVLGAVMANGLAGLEAEDNVVALALTGGGAVKSASAFVGGHAEHCVELVLSSGQSLSIAVKGLQGTQVDFALGEGDGDLAFTEPPKTKATGTGVSQSKINALVGGTFPLHITNPGGLGGAYTITIVAK